MKNELTELSHKVKAISTKGFTKDLINTYKGDISIFYYKYFYSGMLQNYFLLIPAKKINILVALLIFIRGKLEEYQKKVLKI